MREICKGGKGFPSFLPSFLRSVAQLDWIGLALSQKSHASFFFFVFLFEEGKMEDGCCYVDEDDDGGAK